MVENRPEADKFKQPAVQVAVDSPVSTETDIKCQAKFWPYKSRCGGSVGSMIRLPAFFWFFRREDSGRETKPQADKFRPFRARHLVVVSLKKIPGAVCARDCQLSDTNLNDREQNGIGYYFLDSLLWYPVNSTLAFFVHSFTKHHLFQPPPTLYPPKKTYLM